MQIYHLPIRQNGILKTNALQTNSYRVTFSSFCQCGKIATFLIFASIFLHSCQFGPIPNEVQEADRLLWIAPDSCLNYIAENPLDTYREYVQKRYQLIEQHARMKLNHGIEDDSVVICLKEYFEKKKDYQHAGEACYMLGRNLSGVNDPLATFYLKKAEEAFAHCESVNPLMEGMTYYSLGMCEEDNRLFEVARNYYCKALPYMQSNPYYAACAYRDIFRCSDETDSQVNSFIDSALLYARQTPYEDIIREIEIIKYDNLLQFDTSLIFENEKYLCDSLGYYVYANELAEHYLNSHQPDSALYYIDLLALDTANSVWSKEHYYYRQAQYMAAIGCKDTAIAILQDLHNRQTAEIEMSAYTRTYMVSQHYDAERERAGKEKAQLQRRIAYLVIALLLVLMAAGAGMLLFRWQREKTKAELQTERNQRLEEELQAKREILRVRLKQRIQFVWQLRRATATGRSLTAEEVYTLAQEIVCLDNKQWKEVFEEFDQAYHLLLTRLKNQHPALTNGDKQYIVLCLLGCKVQEICFALNLTSRTIWNRKQIVAQHLYLPQDTDLDQWLRQQINRG